MNFKILNVTLKNNNYPIYIGKNNLKNIFDHIKGNSVFIITNDTIDNLGYLKNLKIIFNNSDFNVKSYIIVDGEKFKTIDTVMLIIDKAIEYKLDRKTTFIALGGGVIGDIVGFSASIYQRGVNFIQIPTTLMAMVDSSVGGKTAVNHKLAKNMIGTFYQPECVIIDILYLDTLPDREIVSGMAEVIKYSIINDEEFFFWLEKNINNFQEKKKETFFYIIEKCCLNKSKFVIQDEKEQNLRALLNLGHTFGHALEKSMGYGNLLHGEAVSIGICMAANLSLKLDWISKDIYFKIENIFQKYKLPVTVPESISVKKFNELMIYDKKNENNKLRLILIKNIGNCIISENYCNSKLQETIQCFIN